MPRWSRLCHAAALLLTTLLLLATSLKPSNAKASAMEKQQKPMHGKSSGRGQQQQQQQQQQEHQRQKRQDKGQQLLHGTGHRQRSAEERVLQRVTVAKTAAERVTTTSTAGQPQARLKSSPAPERGPALPPVTQVSVIGERHSGTNFMLRLVRTNLAPSINVTDEFCAYKHYFQAPGPQCPDLAATLVIVIFRNPLDWALAMHKQCWCADAHDELTQRLQKLKLAKFLQVTWHDTIRSKRPAPAGVVEQLHTTLSRLMHGQMEQSWAEVAARAGAATCDHLLQCRARKHANFLNISSWAPRVEYVRHEDVITPHQSLRWLSSVLARHGLPQVNASLQGIDMYKHHRLPANTTLRAGELAKLKAKLAFDAESAMSKSLWFHPEAADQSPEQQQFLDLVDKMAVWDVEEKTGYARKRYPWQQVAKQEQ